jgi:multiple sugar transport system permease protein
MEKLINLILKVFFALFILIPFVWIFSTSFKPLLNVMKDVSPFSIKTFIPSPFVLDAYKEVIINGFGYSLVLSIFIAAVVVLFGILFNSLAGFAFARIDFPGKNILFGITLLSFLIPFEAISVPLYVTVQKLGFLDTIFAIIIPSVANGLSIFLFRQFFLGLPSDLVEAAKIDGAGWFTIYYKLFLPMSKPAMISAGMLLFISQWQAFVWPLLAVQSKRLRIVQVAIAFMSRDEHTVFWNQLGAASILTALIPLLLVIPFQKYYVSGISRTGLKA